jgi:hypothetical protein
VDRRYELYGNGVSIQMVLGYLVAKLLLDTHELVVLCSTLTTAGSASLDLASAKANNKVGNSCVLSLAGPVGNHDTPALIVSHGASLHGLPDCADLVNLEEEA